MKHFFTSKIGRLRLVAFLEGLSLLALVCIAVPAKHAFGDPTLVRIIGPIHGLLFLLFIFNTLGVGVEQQWKFRTTTWKVLLACIIPFGTFYIDRKILRKINSGPEVPVSGN
jgi:integral membrane protein